MWKYLELSRTLAGLYYVREEIIALLIGAGFSPGDFDLTGRGAVLWTLIIKRLEQQGRIKQLVEQVLKEYPDNPVLLHVMRDEPMKVKSVYSAPGDELKWKEPAGGVKKLEKIIGEQSTLLPISFLETGMKRSTSVARVVTPDSLGSGFLIGADNLFLTNNHVLESAATAGGSKVQFNYQKKEDGGTAKFEEFEVDNAFFHTSVDDDWSIVKIKNNPVAKYGYLKLKPAAIAKNDFVNIIQHPGGEHKQVGMYHNMVTYADDNIIQYLTDTMPGSSGAPVFNSRWDVVALHHSGGWIEEPGTTMEVLRNEGININKIIKWMEKNNIAF